MSIDSGDLQSPRIDSVHMPVSIFAIFCTLVCAISPEEGGREVECRGPFLLYNTWGYGEGRFLRLEWHPCCSIHCTVPMPKQASPALKGIQDSRGFGMTILKGKGVRLWSRVY